MNNYNLSKFIRNVNYPTKAMLEIVRRCNLSCPACPVGNKTAIMFPDMEYDVFKHIINKVSQFVSNLSLFNYGEPLLHPRIFEFIKYAKDSGIKKVQFSSNGTLLTKKTIPELIQSGLDKIRISLDGANQETYSKYRINGDFNQLVTNIRALIKTRGKMNSIIPQVELQCIVMSQNERNLKEFENLAKNLCADIVSYKTFNAHFSGFDKVIENLKYLPSNQCFSRYEDKTGNVVKNLKPPSACCFLSEMIVINSDGTLVPCCYDFNNQYPLGNVKNGAFESWWRTPERYKFIEKQANDSDIPDICKHCPKGIIKLRKNEDIYDIIM